MIHSISDRRRVELTQYERLKKEWRKLTGNNRCCVPACARPADRHPHHVFGRIILLLLVTPLWKPICRPHHARVKDDPLWAREIGLAPPKGLYNHWPPAEIMTEMLTKPVWKNGPPICVQTLLPAFPKQGDLKKFLETSAPGVMSLKEFECPACRNWHALTTGPDPGGASSGTGRSKKLDKFNYINARMLGAGFQLLLASPLTGLICPKCKTDFIPKVTVTNMPAILPCPKCRTRFELPDDYYLMNSFWR